MYNTSKQLINDLIIKNISSIHKDVFLDESKFYGNSKKAIIKLKEQKILYASQISLNDLYLIHSTKTICIILLLFINQDYIGKKINQLEILEMVIKTYYGNGLDLLNKNSVDNYLSMLKTMFEDWFRSYNRKILGSKIRQSKNLIAIRQGKYIHITMIKVPEESICFLIKDIQRQLLIYDEVSADDIYVKYRPELNKLGVINSHYMFSLLKKYFNYYEDIGFYRNTYVKKFIRVYVNESEENIK